MTKLPRPNRTLRARRRGIAVRHHFRQALNGAGDPSEVTSDIVTDLLLAIPTAEWREILRDGLISAVAERYRDNLAPTLDVHIDGMPVQPEGW